MENELGKEPMVGVNGGSVGYKNPPADGGGGGRPAGVPNKTTGKAREMLANLAENSADDVQEALLQIKNGIKEGDESSKWLVKPDPKGYVDTLLKAYEYHIPKLQRTEIMGAPGEAPVRVVLVDDIPDTPPMMP